MDTEEVIGLIIVGCFIVSAIVTQVIYDFNQAKTGMISFFTSKYAFITYGLIILSIILYYNYKVHYWFIKRRERKDEQKKLLLKNMEESEELLKKNIGYLDSTKLKEHHNILKEKLNSIKKSKDDELIEELKEKIKEIKIKLPTLIEKEKVDKIHSEERIARENLKNLKDEIEQKALELREFEETSLRKLNAYDNPVFIEKNLTEKEKDLLLKYHFQKAFEYCIDRQEFIHVLVKPTMKHSVTHTFLVWSAMKMLNKIDGVKDIYDADTKEADVVFTYNKKKFALEIETGTLLKKKSQLRAKIDYLDSKYKNVG